MNTGVVSDVDRDLQDARVLLVDAEGREDGQRYRKAAEIILLKILNVDPTNSEARALIAQTKTAMQPVPVPVREDHGFTASPARVEPKRQPKRPKSGGRISIVLGGAAVLAIGIVVYATRTSRADTPVAVEAQTTAPSSPVPVPEVSQPAPSAPETVSTVSEPVPPLQVAPAKAVPETGSLAVNSPVAADIYLGDKLLGSTPTTIQLPAGKQTLEYRHGAMRAVMTHDVKPKETATAFVTFDVTVQINARPWAQVFLEGSTRKALGQTPLSSVRVPIGSVLTFENPSFPSTTRRVAETDSSIQVTFP